MEAGWPASASNIKSSLTIQLSKITSSEVLPRHFFITTSRCMSRKKQRYAQKVPSPRNEEIPFNPSWESTINTTYLSPDFSRSLRDIWSTARVCESTDAALRRQLGQGGGGVELERPCVGRPNQCVQPVGALGDERLHHRQHVELRRGQVDDLPEFARYSLPHLMVYWISPISTAPLDATIDLTCSAFVQTTNKWVLGQSLPSYTTLGEWANHENNILVTVIFHSALPGWWLYLGGDAIQNDVVVTLSSCERIMALLTGWNFSFIANAIQC